MATPDTRFFPCTSTTAFLTVGSPAARHYLAKDPFGCRCHANAGVRLPETASRRVVKRDLIIRTIMAKM